MALHQETRSAFGVPATYHRVGALRLDYQAGFAEVAVLGYASDEARHSGASAMTVCEMRIPFSDLGSGDPSRADVYAAIKALPEFSGAVDC
ncbi:hypothetical protein [Azospirillum picis]|uniref:Uncharacterized protein n=1 Tax=Azospirillum picis TaxID=488438 RepID=A0ABU0MPK6_9PROT|nr:hypothetical protein [Azospirillum picis]MBP2301573.1 hypothetical protein [Azospirillum picis]MDQ0535405.1 hypothetical protein [Azospirillum picis]